MDYKPSSYNVRELPPETDEGKYLFRVEKIGREPEKKEGLPQLQIQLKIRECLGEQDARNLGASVFMRVTFSDENVTQYRMQKEDLQGLCKAAGVDLDVVPEGEITKKADFDELVDELLGKEIEGWVKHSKAKEEGGRVFVNVTFREPKAAASNLGANDDDEDDRPRRSSKTTAKKSARR